MKNITLSHSYLSMHPAHCTTQTTVDRFEDSTNKIIPIADDVVASLLTIEPILKYFSQIWRTQTSRIWNEWISHACMCVLHSLLRQKEERPLLYIACCIVQVSERSEYVCMSVSLLSSPPPSNHCFLCSVSMLLEQTFSLQIRIDSFFCRRKKT